MFELQPPCVWSRTFTVSNGYSTVFPANPPNVPAVKFFKLAIATAAAAVWSFVSVVMVGVSGNVSNVFGELRSLDWVISNTRSEMADQQVRRKGDKNQRMGIS